MANTLTKSTDGNVFYEDNDGKTAGNTYSGDGDTSGTFTYRAGTLLGDSIIYIEYTTANDAGYDYIQYDTVKNAVGFVQSFWFKFGSGATTGNYFTPLITADPISNKAPSNWSYLLNHFINNTTQNINATYKIASGQASANYNVPFYSTTAGLMVDTWYNMKVIYIEGQNARVLIHDENYNIIVEWNMSDTELVVATDSWSAIRFVTANSKELITRQSIQTSTDVIFAGLSSGMTLRVEENNTSKNYDLRTTGTTATLDTISLFMPMLDATVKVYGTDGSLLHTESNVIINGGDTWTYSGDTEGSGSGGGAISIISSNTL